MICLFVVCLFVVVVVQVVAVKETHTLSVVYSETAPYMICLLLLLLFRLLLLRKLTLSCL